MNKGIGEGKIIGYVESQRDFNINIGDCIDVIKFEVAFYILMQIDKIINGNYLSLGESDLKTFKEDGEIDLVLGTQGYQATIYTEDSKRKTLMLIFIEGGLE